MKKILVNSNSWTSFVGLTALASAGIANKKKYFLTDKIFLFATTLCLLSSCGAGTGEGLDAQGNPMNPSSDQAASSSTSSQANGVSLSMLQQNIFGAICINCHVGNTAPHGLRLDTEDNAYAFLVNQASEENPNLMRVKPGFPEDSYIVKKIEGAPDIFGNRMPLGGPYLSQEQINSIRTWIQEGAPRTGTGN